MKLILLGLVAVFGSDSEESNSPPDWGHSRHGSAYDEGPRQRPWKMEGIGSVHFPITSSHPEVQEWFNQGIALLHSFWPYEAERSFRWCLKLDPECAMAYWGLARSHGLGVGGPLNQRRQSFLEEATKRKEQVSERERAYIEIEEALAALGMAEDKEAQQNEVVLKLDRLVMDYPDDLEAKAFYWVATSRWSQDRSRLAQEFLLSSILDADPDHVGAHHYRVHNWDGKEGSYAIDSCKALSEIALGSGHLQHMPGHVLSGIGMWHEAAIAMDSATRVEKDYMHRRRVLPENNWDYIHNLDYLGYIQEQLGMFELAIQSAEQGLLAPPRSNAPKMGPFGGLYREPMIRVLLRAQRWEEILDGGALAWSSEPSPFERMRRAYVETRAHIGLLDLVQAEHSFVALKEAMKELASSLPPGQEGPPGGENSIEKRSKIIFDELEGRLCLLRGDRLKAITLLTEAAEAQEESWTNDPPQVDHFGYTVLGETFLELGSPKLAVDAFEKTLETVFHDGFALCGLVQAYHQLGEKEKASQAMAALDVAWSDADANNPWLRAAKATGVEAWEGELPERLRQVMTQRNYRQHSIDRLGPSLYAAVEAPELSALDANGHPVSLKDFEGKNVLVIFYLGEQCVHCIEQLKEAEKHVEAFGELNTEILAISKDSVETIAGCQEDFQSTLLSDIDFESAKRFGSFDEFEEIELHSTILVDAKGRLHWTRNGGEPYMDFDFLKSELVRMNEGGQIHRILEPESRAKAQALESR